MLPHPTSSLAAPHVSRSVSADALAEMASTMLMVNPMTTRIPLHSQHHAVVPATALVAYPPAPASSASQLHMYAQSTSGGSNMPIILPRPPSAPSPPVVSSQPTGKRRRRLTSHETKILTEEFDRNPRPTPTTRHRMAMLIPGMSARAIQVWFQNRRSKWKQAKQASAVKGDETPMPASRPLSSEAPSPVSPPPPPSPGGASAAAPDPDGYLGRGSGLPPLYLEPLSDFPLSPWIESAMAAGAHAENPHYNIRRSISESTMLEFVRHMEAQGMLDSAVQSPDSEAPPAQQPRKRINSFRKSISTPNIPLAYDGLSSAVGFDDLPAFEKLSLVGRRSDDLPNVPEDIMLDADEVASKQPEFLPDSIYWASFPSMAAAPYVPAEAPAWAPPSIIDHLPPPRASHQSTSLLPPSIEVQLPERLPLGEPRASSASPTSQRAMRRSQSAPDLPLWP